MEGQAQVEFNPSRVDKVTIALGRLQDYAARRVETRTAAGGPTQREKAEYHALTTAIETMRYHALTLSPATSPVLALRELLDALDRGDQAEVERIKFRARHILSKLA